MDHSWLQRCLRAASTPPEILTIVESLRINMPVLILDGVEFEPLHLASGLTQGCPVSCMLYIIGVDPLLSSLQQTPRVSGVSGFVDDWSMGCQVEQASGQIINRGKSSRPDSCLMLNAHLVSQFGAVISASRFMNVCLVFTSEYMRPLTTSTTTQSTNLT